MDEALKQLDLLRRFTFATAVNWIDILLVTYIFYRLLGLVRTSVVNTVSAGQAWQPTQPMSVVLGLSTIVGTVLPSSIEVRFTPLDTKGQWQVDDVYIDPFARH